MAWTVIDYNSVDSADSYFIRIFCSDEKQKAFCTKPRGQVSHYFKKLHNKILLIRELLTFELLLIIRVSP